MRGVPVLVAVVLVALAPGARALPIVDGVLKPEPSPPNQPKPEPEPAPPPKPHKGKKASTKRLSNERTLSRWAYVVRATVARRNPSRHSKRIKKLRSSTPDGTPELVLALSERRGRDGRLWVRVRLPMRPNGRKGWVRRGRLGAFRAVRTRLWIDRKRFVAKLYRRGRVIWRAPVGVGRPGWPTPSGRFYVRERLIPVERGSIYGAFAFGTSAYSPVLTDWPGGGMVGVHGTNEPGLIPGRISHGCVRVRNGPISRLRKLMPLGTPIRIVG